MPEILCIQTWSHDRTQGPGALSLTVSKTLKLPTAKENKHGRYELVSTIHHLRWGSHDHYYTVIYDKTRKCIVSDQNLRLMDNPEKFEEVMKYCQFLFYERSDEPVEPDKNREESRRIGITNAQVLVAKSPNETTSSIKSTAPNKGEIVKSLLRFNDNTPQNQRDATAALCAEFHDVFIIPGEKLSHTTAGVFRLPMKTGHGPTHIKQFRTDPETHTRLREMIKDLEFHNVIERSFSPYNFPVFLRPKPERDSQGRLKMRMCVDYQKLNDDCVPYFFPIPRIDEIHDQLHGMKYFTCLDMSQGYHQVLVAAEDRAKLAFTVDNVHWQFRRAPFGLKTLPGFFQATVHSMLAELVGTVCLVYLDDIMVMARTREELLERTRSVFERLRKYNFKLNAEKCNFLREEVRYLGYRCSKDGIRPDTERVSKVLNFPAPSNKNN